MNLLIIPPTASAYDVLIDFSDQLFNAVHEMNPSTFQYQITRGQTMEEVLKELQEICHRCDISHVISFNAAGQDIFKFLQADHMKFVGWLVDYPNYHFERLNSSLKSKYVLGANPNHGHCIQDLTSSQYAGVLTLGISDIGKNIFTRKMNDRDFDVVFVGSWMGFPEKFWGKINDPLIQKITKETLDLLHADDCADPYLILKNAFIQHGLDIPKHRDLLNKLLWHINTFNRKYSQLKMMNAVAQSGLKALIVGDGWSDHFALPHLYFHEPVPNHLIGKIYEQSKIVIGLNSNNGGCERALQALSSGCSVFSFGGIPIENFAKDTHRVHLSNSWDSEEIIAQKLRETLVHTMDSRNLALDITHFQEKHSWANASAQLLKAIESIDSVEMSV